MSYYVRYGFKPAQNRAVAFDLAMEFLSSLDENPEDVIKENLYFLARNTKGDSSDLFLLRYVVHRMMEVRFVFWPEYNLLGIPGGWFSDELLKKNGFSIFNFQNSTDQNYEFTDWPDIPYFHSVIDRVRAMTKKEILDTVKDTVDDDEDVDWDEVEDYARKTAVYQQVFSDLEIDNILYNGQVGNGTLFVMNAICDQGEDSKNAIRAIKLLKDFNEEI